jgi:preprotein translocase subunit SecA
MLSAAQSAAEMIDIDPADLEEWRQTISRNAECPCGSGQKFKHCHGAL